MKSFIHELQNLKPRYEQRYRESIIDKYSTVRGTVEDRPVFSQLWQCYAWAAIIGFINDRHRALSSPINTSFDFSVISNNGPEISKALICLALSKSSDNIDCLKNPTNVMSIIEQYANGGFDYISEMLVEKGEHYFDSFENFINADPTKGFFIYMLTRDISLERAIIDLIDNSVDGAKESQFLKGKGFTSIDFYKGFKIDISFNNNHFIIQDNCGGFSKEAALKFAFKFGRPKDANSYSKNSVGRFGVGMKRALFKIGDYFIVETKCKKDHFFVEEDVINWSQDDNKWEFEFKDATEKSFDKHVPILKTDGTFIKITNINEAVGQDFSLSTFENKLKVEIERTLNYSINKGLEITLNKIPLSSRPIQLLVSDNLKPFYYEENILNVNVKIFAGVGEPDPNMAGWYIYCNDRLMVEKDKTNLTGWEGSNKSLDDSGVQKYHNKVAMFRGLVFFSSEDSSLLPMTTTKWGIDVNSTIYKTVRAKMIHALKQVIADLNKLSSSEQRSEIVKNSTACDIVSYDSNQLKSEFIFPEIIKTNFNDKKSKISYRVDKELLSKVKKSLIVDSNQEVGEKTFNFYVDLKEIR